MHWLLSRHRQRLILKQVQRSGDIEPMSNDPSGLAHSVYASMRTTTPTLRARGFRVRRSIDVFTEWKAYDLSVEGVHT
jgi:hypothetical protein